MRESDIGVDARVAARVLLLREARSAAEQSRL
jgi:hypothetical protein